MNESDKAFLLLCLIAAGVIMFVALLIFLHARGQRPSKSEREAKALECKAAAQEQLHKTAVAEATKEELVATQNARLAAERAEHEDKARLLAATHDERIELALQEARERHALTMQLLPEAVRNEVMSRAAMAGHVSLIQALQPLFFEYCSSMPEDKRPETLEGFALRALMSPSSLPIVPQITTNQGVGTGAPTAAGTGNTTLR